MKRILTTAVLTSIAFVGAATTASAGTTQPRDTIRSTSTVHANGIAHPNCGGPNGCPYQFLAAYLSFYDCNTAGPTDVPRYYSDYYCVEDDFHTSDHSPMWDLMVLPYS